VAVDGGTLLDEGVDVGDGHENLNPAARPRLNGRQLIEIKGIVVIDRAPEEITAIPDRRIRLGSRCHNGVRLREDRRREVWQ
jgi:hypothetical protein